MFLWFIVLSVVGVYAVFRDETMDFRFVAAGSLLPDVVDAAVRRGVGPLHSVVVGVGMLFGVVVATVGRRSARKRWLALPIGIFAHQILDFSWTSTHVFWWPLTGLSLHGRIPAVEHGLVRGLLEEAVALAVGVAVWRSFRLTEPARRARFLRTGQLFHPRPQGTSRIR